MFIELKIDHEACARAGDCKVCVETCPVDIFALADAKVIVNHENEDECTLCDQCLTKCPAKAITLTRLY